MDGEPMKQMKLSWALLLAFALSSAAASGQNTSALAIAVSDLPDPVRVGATLTYSIAVTNGGPHAAGNVFVYDVLPTNVNFVSCL